MPKHTREEIVEAAKKAASECNEPLSLPVFKRLSGISHDHIARVFPEGRWSEVKRLAGLERHPNDNDAVSDEDLLKAYHRVTSEIGRTPTWAIFSARANISDDTIRRRFGGLQGTLKHYQLWLEKNEPNSPFLEQLQTKSKHEVPALPLSQAASFTPSKLAAWTKGSGPQFGPPINFRGLRHAPINEQGVVFLFGMVSYELGFIVEAVHGAFPDCEAKRCVDNNNQRWQRVRIEFEFYSSNFRDHGHDPKGCDVIICWEHDWQDCPIEVIELRRVIDKLEG